MLYILQDGLLIHTVFFNQNHSLKKPLHKNNLFCESVYTGGGFMCLIHKKKRS